jgi:hypothetical protein
MNLLPSELQYRILLFLDTSSLLRFGSTSKQNRMIANDILFRDYLQRHRKLKVMYRVMGKGDRQQTIRRMLNSKKLLLGKKPRESTRSSSPYLRASKAESDHILWRPRRPNTHLSRKYYNYFLRSYRFKKSMTQLWIFANLNLSEFPFSNQEWEFKDQPTILLDDLCYTLGKLNTRKHLPQLEWVPNIFT